jgi:hypothetical protein
VGSGSRAPFLFSCACSLGLSCVFGISFSVGSGSARSLSFPHYVPLEFFLILCFGISLVGSGSARSLFLSSLAHVPLGFLILCFLNQFSVGSGSARSLSFPHLRMFPWVLILCFGISLVGVRIALLSFSLTCSLQVLILCFGISLSVGSGSALLSFSSLARMFPWGFDLCLESSLSVGSGSALLSFPHLHVPLGF